MVLNKAFNGATGIHWLQSIIARAYATSSLLECLYRCLDSIKQATQCRRSNTTTTLRVSLVLFFTTNNGPPIISLPACFKPAEEPRVLRTSEHASVYWWTLLVRLRLWFFVTVWHWTGQFPFPFLAQRCGNSSNNSTKKKR